MTWHLMMQHILVDHAPTEYLGIFQVPTCNLFNACISLDVHIHIAIFIDSCDCFHCLDRKCSDNCSVTGAKFCAHSSIHNLIEKSGVVGVNLRGNLFHDFESIFKSTHVALTDNRWVDVPLKERQ